jgi:hypothetical protein
MSEKSVMVEDSGIEFVCDKDKTPFSRRKAPGEGSTIKMFYAGDEVIVSEDEFNYEMELGKNALTGKPNSGLFNHFKLVKAPPSIIEKYDKFKARAVTKDEILALHPTNARLLAERLAIKGFDTAEITSLVPDIHKRLEADHEAQYERMRLAAENKAKQSRSVADVHAENEALKARIAELEGGGGGNAEKALDKMNKAELTEKAKSLEIEVTEDMTKAQILDAIKEKG